MRAILKALSVVLVISMITAFFTGCTAEEKSLFDALVKSSEITSMENSTNLKIHFNVKGLSEEESVIISQIADILNNMEIKVEGKTIQNKEKTALKQDMDLSLSLLGVTMNMGIWQDIDFSGEKPVMTQVMEIPAFFRMYLPEEFYDKQYLVMGQEDLAESESNTQLNYKKIIELSTTLQNRMLDFVKDNIDEFDPGFVAVTRKENKIVDGETLAVYELKLNDGAFKDLLKYFINNTLKSKSTLELFKEVAASFTGLADVAGDGSEEATTEDKELLEEDLSKNIQEFIDKANIALSAFEDVKFIGEKGITITYAVNSEGYIVEENGYIDLVIDTGAIEDASNRMKAKEAGKKIYVNKPSKSYGTYEIGLEFSSAISDINKVEDFELPQVDSSNSISFNDLMGFPNYNLDDYEDYEYVEEDFPFSVLVDYEYLDFTADPYFEGDTLMVEARTVFEALGADVQWNGKDKTVVITKDDISVVLKQNSRTALLNGSEVTLDAPVTVVEGKTMVPAEFVAEAMKVKMELYLEEEILFYTTIEE